MQPVLRHHDNSEQLGYGGGAHPGRPFIAQGQVAKPLNACRRELCVQERASNACLHSCPCYLQGYVEIDW